MSRLPSVGAFEDQPRGQAHRLCRAAIAVCTAQRATMLRRCLASIGLQILPCRIGVDVVVVDNEAEPKNRRFVEEFSTNCRFPVHYVHEPRRGIPQARNAALEKCAELGVDWIAFTDDDCCANPTWLANLFVAADKYRADVVYGRREFAFPVPLPFWAMRPEQGVYAEGQKLLHAATHNVLFAASLVRAGHLMMRFDERLAHGEDTDFFHRAALRGAHIVYSAEPIVVEAVSPDRATLNYEMRRAYFHAASRSYLLRRYSGTRQACVKLAARCAFQAPVAFARLAVAPLAWPFSGDAFRMLVIKGVARLAGSAGAIAGFLGFDGNPYRRIDGY